MTEKIWIGIDVAKAKIDMYRGDTDEHVTVSTTKSSLAKLAKKIGEGAHAIVEASGGYEKIVMVALIEAGVNVSCVNPRRARNWANGMGMLAKTDQLDAKMLALYGAATNPKPFELPPESVQELHKWVKWRERLIRQSTELRNSDELADKEIKKESAALLRSIRTRISKAEEKIAAIIDNNETLLEKSGHMQSIKGVGQVTASTLLAMLPELGNVSHKQLSALCGLAPFANDSGTMRGKRRLGHGRSAVKRVLCIAALVARRSNPVYIRHYEKLLVNGKSKTTATVAIARKLLGHLNALVRDGVDFQPSMALSKEAENA